MHKAVATALYAWLASEDKLRDTQTETVKTNRQDHTTDRQTDGQTQTDRQTDRQAGRQVGTAAEGADEHAMQLNQSG